MDNLLSENIITEDSVNSHKIDPNWFKFAFAVSLLGIAVYLPSMRTNFFMDDVDFFGGLCESIAKGDTVKWLFSFSNGHLAVIPKIGYWINYLFFDRSIILWHVTALLLHAISVISMFYIVYFFIGNLRLTILISTVFATSTVYSENLLSTNSFNHLCAVAFTLLSLSLLCHYMRYENGAFYLFSVAAAFGAILSSATGLIAFPAHLIFIWSSKLKQGKGLVYSASIMLTALTFATFWFMGAKGESGSSLNIFFGLNQTFLGITKVTVVRTLKVLGIPMLILAVVNMALFHRFVNWQYVTVSLFLAVAPLFMSLSFREDFASAYRWTRYHHLPAVGVILFIGLGFLTPNMEPVRKYFMPKKIGWYLLIIFFVYNSAYIFHKNLKKDTHAELRTYEDRLGEACLEYSKLYNTKEVNVPEVKTSLPNFPFLRDLIYICRYSTSYGSHLKFKIAPNDKRLIEILKSDQKYGPILTRLKQE